MNQEEFKLHIQEILELQASFNNNKALYNEIRTFISTFDYFRVPEYLNTNKIVGISHTYMLNLLLNMPNDKKSKYREDILLTQIEMLDAKENNKKMLEVIGHFRENIFEYFVKKTRAQNTFTPNSFVYIHNQHIIYGELVYGIFECKSYSIALDCRYDSNEYKIQETFSTKHIQISKEYTADKFKGYDSECYVAVKEWQLIYEPEEYL